MTTAQQTGDNKDAIRLVAQMAIDEEAHRRELSARQASILNMWFDGMTGKMVCNLLKISEGTYKGHCEGLFQKLGVASRGEAIARVLGRLP